MIISKQDLIEYIIKMDCDVFDMDVSVTKPAMSWETTDTRTGAIYPPRPFTPRKMYSTGETRLNIIAYTD